jgi:phosphoribosylpyrophosphate synthetase
LIQIDRAVGDLPGFDLMILLSSICSNRGSLVAKNNGFHLAHYDIFQFPDGSNQIFCNLENREVVIYYEFQKPFDLFFPNLLRIISLVEKKNKIIGVASPFFPFLREKSDSFLSFSFDLLKVPIITIDAHSNPSSNLYNQKILNVSSDFFISKVIRDSDLCVFPDQGAFLRYKNFIKNDYVVGKKTRGVGVFFENSNLILNRNCFVIDDIVDSGETLKMVLESLRVCGALKVGLFATHNLYGNLESLGFDFCFSTNSLNHAPEVLDYFPNCGRLVSDHEISGTFDFVPGFIFKEMLCI